MAYRRGLVDQIGTGEWLGYARVRFPDRDNALSWWLPVGTQGAQGTKRWHMPKVGAQVALDMDENDEDGYIHGEVWSKADAPPDGATPDQDRTDYGDGTRIIYDEASHTLTVSLCSGGTGTMSTAAGNQVKLDASGNVLIKGGAGGNVSIQPGAGGKVLFSLDGAATGDALALVSKLIAAFNGHTHPSNGAAPSQQWTTETVASDTTAVTN